jgi:glucan phosphoethanolaminetransferase (alkaline phosphatase superfamily)
LIFTGCYLFAVAKLPFKVIPLKTALAISATSIVILGIITVYVNQVYRKSFHEVSRRDLILKYDYPVTLASGAHEARVFLKKNTLKEAETFSFRAVKNDTLPHRQVYVLIIGESSRHDRWQINGYRRETSPLLNTVKDLITYRDVVAGAHYTWVSVPQIITRANPDNYNLQYREKSILGVFREAGFHTYWLSNQSDQDIFWSGSITLHAKTADVSMFSPT